MPPPTPGTPATPLGPERARSPTRLGAPLSSTPRAKLPAAVPLDAFKSPHEKGSVLTAAADGDGDDGGRSDRGDHGGSDDSDHADGSDKYNDNDNAHGQGWDRGAREKDKDGSRDKGGSSSSSRKSGGTRPKGDGRSDRSGGGFRTEESFAVVGRPHAPGSGLGFVELSQFYEILCDE
ncbi:hypothetical protein CDEST_05588 [Colletotrichum destructivum]|uniref:Uncharacterized protein n=1 Tax=Colletotrichum destructivum TaxID=34406 RepID=A0AAX4IC81_9PEZI|nr:hypothetical protein CDEST_05588 [Colletotrichum destructivum]